MKNMLEITVLFGVLASAIFATYTGIIKTQRDGSFRRGVECSVYYQPTKCGPQVAYAKK